MDRRTQQLLAQIAEARAAYNEAAIKLANYGQHQPPHDYAATLHDQQTANDRLQQLLKQIEDVRLLCAE